MSDWTSNSIYSQTCIKRSPLGQWKSGLIRQVTSEKRLIWYEIFYDGTRKRWPLKTGDCLIEVITWAGLSVFSLLNFNSEKLYLFHFKRHATVVKYNNSIKKSLNYALQATLSLSSLFSWLSIKKASKSYTLLHLIEKK